MTPHTKEKKNILNTGLFMGILMSACLHNLIQIDSFKEMWLLTSVNVSVLVGCLFIWVLYITAPYRGS